MAAGYSREFLVDAYLSRFMELPIEILCTLEENAYKLYDKVGKDKFRDYASLDAEAIRKYRDKGKGCTKSSK